MSLATKIPLLLIGQVPPPWHGQAVANKLLFDHNWEDYDVEILPMTYSKSMGQVGKLRAGKILHFLRLLFRARSILSRTPEALVFYPPASANWAPFLRDVFFLLLLGGKRENRVFIFHAAGLPQFAGKGRVRRLLARMAYGGAGMALEVSEEAVPPHEMFGIEQWIYCPCGVEVPVDSEPLATRPNDGVCTVLYLGALREGKGILDVIETARLLRDSGRDDFRFRLIGDWASKEFKELSMETVERAQLESIVEFPGRAIGEEKWNEYRKADVFFFPTHYSSESSPLVLMEALGMGLSVLTTNWSGIRKMLDGCQTSVILPIKSPQKYAAALLELNDGGLSENSANDSRQYYEERFTPDVYISRVEKALQSVWQQGQRD
jgi:glycosyltransferase involved in cell wall biosynthesis